MPPGEYPLLLSKGKKINTEYTTFNITPRKFKDREMISIGLDLEGKTICYDRKSGSRICSLELRSKRPDCDFPKELRFDPDYNYSDKEIKDLNKNKIEWSKKYCDPQEDAWNDEVEKQPLIDFKVAAVDDNNREIPFVFAGQGQGYCSDEKDQVCSQFSIDKEKSDLKSLENVTIKAVKIKSVEGELKIANIYVVGHYTRE